MWRIPARTISQAMSTLTATPATIGAATANMPKQISETPQRIDQVEARRTRSEEFCPINTSSTDGGGVYPSGSGSAILVANEDPGLEPSSKNGGDSGEQW